MTGRKLGRKTGGKNRTPLEVERDRLEIAERYLRGQYQSEIAKEMGMTQPQVSLELKTIRERWLESSIRDFDQAKSEELAKIDLVEKEAWEAWKRSTQDKTLSIDEDIPTKTGVLKKATRKRESRDGNHNFLIIINNCIDKRCAILGINSELKYQDINLAIAAVVRAGFEVRDVRSEDNTES